MKIKLLHTGIMGTNTYVLCNEETKECVVFDPADAQTVLDFLLGEGLACTHILLTHGHFDHVMGVAALKKATGAKVYIAEADAQELLPNAERKLNKTMWGHKIEPCDVDVFPVDGDVIEAAGFKLKAIATPGHTPGGICYVLEEPEKVIFAGDTLFRVNVGRADLPGGSAPALFASVKEKLFALEGDYAVYPGHAEMTALEYERQHNPYILCGSSEAW